MAPVSVDERIGRRLKFRDLQVFLRWCRPAAWPRQPNILD
jgi:hypothetical protein